MNYLNLYRDATKVMILHLSKKQKVETSLVKNAFYSQVTKSRGKSILFDSPRVPFI